MKMARDFNLFDHAGDEVGRGPLGDTDKYKPCGHEGCDWAFKTDDLGQETPAYIAHWNEHKQACLDITIVVGDCSFCGVTKDDQLDEYLSDAQIDHTFCDPDALDEDGDPAACAECSRDIRGRQVTKCGELYPEQVFCSISCLKDWIASDFASA